MKKIGKYINGETLVHVFDDGTKVRYFKGSGKSELPESIDLCITHKCSGSCSFCYDNALSSGQHGDLIRSSGEFALRCLEDMLPYSELAINGNDMSHPQLDAFLERCLEKRIICNLTINWKHFLEHFEMLIEFQKRDLIKGIGISITEIFSSETMKEFQEKVSLLKNVVFHIVCGTDVSLERDFIEKLSRGSETALLLLGYKFIGRGEKFAQIEANAVTEKIMLLRNMIESWIEDVRNSKSSVRAISFDCLGYEQLGISNIVGKNKEFRKFYMGDDGSHTMFIDAVKKKFSKSSTEIERSYPIEDLSLKEIFERVKMI